MSSHANTLYSAGTMLRIRTFPFWSEEPVRDRSVRELVSLGTSVTMAPEIGSPLSLRTTPLNSAAGAAITRSRPPLPPCRRSKPDSSASRSANRALLRYVPGGSPLTISLYLSAFTRLSRPFPSLPSWTVASDAMGLSSTFKTMRTLARSGTALVCFAASLELFWSGGGGGVPSSLAVTGISSPAPRETTKPSMS